MKPTLKLENWKIAFLNFFVRLFYGKCEETNENYNDDYNVGSLMSVKSDESLKQCAAVMVR